MKRTIFAIILLFLSVVSQSQIINYPKYEVRAVWLTTIGGLDWPHSYAQSASGIAKQKRELCLILDRLRAANINTVLLQTRVRGTTIYPSALEPWDGCLSGKPGMSPGYDALQFAIEECHKRGMELHAWVVTIPVGKWNALGCTNLRKKYPNLIIKIGDEGYLNPESEQTGDYLARICGEITRAYDVDGIHLDYIRYPETWRKKTNKTTGRANITRIVRKISQTVKQEKPWVKMSCSPIGKYDDLARYKSRGWNANSTVCQDAQGWLRDGLMDELFPMMYFKGNNFFPFAIDWAECAHGRIVAPGLGIYMMHPKEQNWPLETVRRELSVLREYGLGHTYFRSKFFTDNVKGIYDFTTRHFDRFPALVPPMTWLSSTRPPSPTNLVIGHARLSWSPVAQDNRPSAYILYNVYASDTYPVDINDARNLLATRLNRTSIGIGGDETGGGTRYYAVTAMNRYGIESEPLQMKSGVNTNYASRMLKNDGHRLQLPEKEAALEADYIVIESIAGNLLTTRPYRGRNVDISGLAEGVYTVRSINRRNVSHKLGMFIIKR